MTLSVVLITYNEEANLPRTLASVKPLVDELGGEIIVLDSGSTDRTREIAESFGAKVFIEEWKGFAAQKNSAIDKAQGEWVLLLDADEEVSGELQSEVKEVLAIGSWPSEIRKLATGAREAVIRRQDAELWAAYEDQVDERLNSFEVPRKNYFLGRWIRRGGFWPDRKLRLFVRGALRVEDRAVHEAIKTQGYSVWFYGPLIHHAYPTLEIYLEHMRRYSALGAEMLRHEPRWWLWLNRWFNPPLTFFYNYVVRLGFLDGREGLLLHWHHARYVSWKYEGALRLQRP